MKVGVFTVGLPDLTPEEAASEIKDAGYDGVEWRVTRVPEEARSEEPSFWGNNLCTLEPTEEEARRASRSLRRPALRYLGLAPTSLSETLRLRIRLCASPWPPAPPR